MVVYTLNLLINMIQKEIKIERKYYIQGMVV